MAKEIKYSIVAGLLVMIGIVVGFTMKEGFSAGKIEEINNNIDKFREALWFVERNYVSEPKTDQLVEDAINGMLEGLDPHSFYIPAKEMQEMDEQMSGSFEGIGVEFNLLKDTIYVVAAIAGGPSEQLGIQSGDRIIKIDGGNVAGTGITNSDVMRKLKGTKGTIVKVDILRRGVKNLLSFEIVRDKIPLQSVDYSYMVNKETGYIKISRFAQTTYDEFRAKLIELKSDGMKNLVLDLRDNPGGYMNEAEKIADEFLAEGKLVVYTEGRIANSKTNYHATDRMSLFEKGALIILMNYGSASASEIVAGAVQDWDRGLIVGVRTFGKGLVQTQKPFADGSAIRLVISRYYTPSGRCIQKPFDMSSEEYDEEILDRFETGEVYDETKIDLPDSLKFTTNSGRSVYGGGGIIPDFFIPRDTFTDSDYLGKLLSKGLFRQFCYEFVDGDPELKAKFGDAGKFRKSFEVTEETLTKFAEYGATNGVPMDAAGFRTSKKTISNYLKAFTGRKLFGDDGFYPVLNDDDNVILGALEKIPSAMELETTGRIASAKK